VRSLNLFLLVLQVGLDLFLKLTHVLQIRVSKIRLLSLHHLSKVGEFLLNILRVVMMVVVVAMGMAHICESRDAKKAAQN